MAAGRAAPRAGAGRAEEMAGAVHSVVEQAVWAATVAMAAMGRGSVAVAVAASSVVGLVADAAVAAGILAVVGTAMVAKEAEMDWAAEAKERVVITKVALALEVAAVAKETVGEV